MADAFIYDAVRTPRGRGKADGSLHEVTALNLAAQTLAAVKDRNKLDPALVDDVVLGCVDPVGEAGGDIARAAALVAGFGDGVPGVQINRFCASGLDAVNFAAAEVMSGQHEMTIGGGVESMSRIGIGASGGAWPVDPSIAVDDLFPAAGHFRRPDRDEVRFFARRRRCLCGRKPEARGQGLGRGTIQEIGHAGEGRQRPHYSGQGRAHAARRRRCKRSPPCSPLSCRWARWRASTQLRCSAIRKSRRSTTSTRRQFLGHRRRRCRGADRQQGGRQGRGPQAARAHPAVRQYRLRARRSC